MSSKATGSSRTASVAWQFAILCLGVMLAMWCHAWAQISQPRVAIAVLDFSLNLTLANADATESDNLPVVLASEQMRAQVAQSEAYVLVNVATSPHAATACTSDACAAQVGMALGVQQVMWGQVTKVSALIWYVSARLIDVHTARPLRAETIQFRGNITDVMPRVIAILWRRLHEAA